jgi:hypothetical protein
VLHNIDMAVQYGEDAEVRVREMDEFGDDGLGDDEGNGRDGQPVMGSIAEGDED